MSNIILPKEFATPPICRPVDDSCVLWISGRGSRRQDSVLNDLSKKGNNGVIHGATWVNTPLGHSALSFDGSNDYVDCGNDESLNIADAITIEAWVKPQFNSQNRRILIKTIGTGSLYAYSIAVRTTGKFIFFIGATNGTYRIVEGTTTYSSNNWYHVVATYDGAQLKLYVNSEMDNTPTNVSTNIITTDGILDIGGGTGLECWKGLIDEVRIYNRALSAKEIKEQYNSTCHFYGK